MIEKETLYKAAEISDFVIAPYSALYNPILIEYSMMYLEEMGKCI